MAEFSTTNVRIVGLVSCVPSTVKEVAEDQFLTAQEVQKVVSSTGVRKFPVASENQCTSDLCFEAASSLLAQLDWEPASVGLLLFVSQTPDHILPATSCILHQRLRLSKNCAAFDINMGCSGYVYGLSVASGLMQSGVTKRALVLVGDTISKISSERDRSVAYLFGDAGSATALEYSESEVKMNWALGTDGSGADFLKVDAGMFRSPSNAQTREVSKRDEGIFRSDEQLSMNGPEVFSFTIREIPAVLSKILSASNWKPEEVDQIVLHQANAYMLKYLVKRMKLPKDKVPICLGSSGNTSSTSIPMAISTLNRESGLAQSSKWVLCGFGVGFSWGAVAFESERPFLIDFIEASDEQS